MKKIFTLFTLFLTYSFASAQCGYVIEMQDSWGDGWNGASIDVSVNGSIVSNVTVSTGSGDTVSVVNSMKIENKFNFVSTAGGAFLEYLEGKILPGIRALN